MFRGCLGLLGWCVCKTSGTEEVPLRHESLISSAPILGFPEQSGQSAEGSLCGLSLRKDLVCLSPRGLRKARKFLSCSVSSLSASEAKNQVNFDFDIEPAHKCLLM